MELSPAVIRIMKSMLGINEDETYDTDTWAKEYLNGNFSVAPSTNPNDKELHLVDWYKMPSHESFSNEARLGKFTGAPKWVGGKLKKGGESWQLTGPNNEVVVTEAPWATGGIQISPDRKRQLKMYDILREMK